MKTQYVAAAVLSALILNPLPAGAEGKDGVAAVVNGKKITVAEIKKTYESAPHGLPITSSTLGRDWLSP